MAEKTKNRPKRQKATFLPGMEPPSVPELDNAADAYYEAKTDRQAKTEVEKNAKTNLIEKMVAEKLTRYETPNGLVVDLLSKSNVTCKNKVDAESNE